MSCRILLFYVINFLYVQHKTSIYIMYKNLLKKMNVYIRVGVCKISSHNYVLNESCVYTQKKYSI